MDNTPVLLVNSLNITDVHALLEEAHDLHVTSANPDPIGLRFLAGEQPTYEGPLQFPASGSLVLAWDGDSILLQNAGITLVNADHEWDFHGPINTEMGGGR